MLYCMYQQKPAPDALRENAVRQAKKKKKKREKRKKSDHASFVPVPAVPRASCSSALPCTRFLPGLLRHTHTQRCKYLYRTLGGTQLLVPPSCTLSSFPVLPHLLLPLTTVLLDLYILDLSPPPPLAWLHSSALSHRSSSLSSFALPPSAPPSLPHSVLEEKHHRAGLLSQYTPCRAHDSPSIRPVEPAARRPFGPSLASSPPAPRRRRFFTRARSRLRHAFSALRLCCSSLGIVCVSLGIMR